MRLPLRVRLAGVAVVCIAVVLVAASWGGWASGDGSAPPRSGPAVSLYVVDHQGASPDAAGLAPYQTAFDRILVGCRITPADLASVVFTVSDQATMGSGIEMNNLRVLQAIAREAGSTPVDCNDTFGLAEARLEGSALG